MWKRPGGFYKGRIALTCRLKLRPDFKERIQTMQQMRFEAPETLDAAVALLASADGEARVLAGGTDLLVQLRAEMIEPALVVDIKRIPEMLAITEESDGGFKIGAAVPCQALGENIALKAAWPGVVEGAELIGSTQIQGRASMGGNLCNASPAADSVPGMVAAGATVSIIGPNGQREIPVQELPEGPGKTTLSKGEVVASINLPSPAPNSADAYLRFIPRTEMDIAVVGAGVAVTLDDNGLCIAARVSLGAVGERVLLVDECAVALIGTPIDDAALDKLAAAASAATQPIDDKRGTKEYRTRVAGVLARRASIIARDRVGAK